MKKQDKQSVCDVAKEARSCDDCCSGRALSIIYSECVFVALDIQCAKSMRHTVNWDLPGCKIVFHIITRIWGEKIIKHKMCSHFLYKLCLKYFSF